MKEPNVFKPFRYNSYRSHGGNAAVIILVFVVLGYVCPNSQQDNRNDAPSAINLNSEPATAPPPSPAASPTPAVDDLDSSEVQARIAKGAQIYKRIEARTGLPVMFGWRARNISLPIPIGDWNKMTKDDQINLTYYAENLVREIRIDPVSYARRWANYYRKGGEVESGMEYDGLYESSYIDQVANLCRTCWDITVGVVKRNGFHDEDVPVKGTTVREFRQAAQKETAKTYEEKEADEFRQFAASMAASEHLAQAKIALNNGYDPSNEKFGNTVLARKHIKAILKNDPEYSEAQKLLQQVAERELERKEFQDAVVREMKRLTEGK
jgi:hypothetical protein